VHNQVLARTSTLEIEPPLLPFGKRTGDAGWALTCKDATSGFAAWKSALGIAAFFGLRHGPGSSRIGLDATATLEERDAGERGRPVYQLVLESRVTGLWCGRLSLAERSGQIVQLMG
jgi:hypothetical protein